MTEGLQEITLMESQPGEFEIVFSFQGNEKYSLKLIRGLSVETVGCGFDQMSDMLLNARFIKKEVKLGKDWLD